MSLLLIFSVLFVTTVVIFISIFYFHITEIVEHAALLLMDKNADFVFKELEDEVKTFEINNIAQVKFNQLLAKYQFGKNIEISLMQPPNTHIASSTQKTAANPWVEEAFSIYQHDRVEPFEYKYKGTKYLAAFKKITTDKGTDWYIIITAPAIVFTSTIHHLETSYVALFSAIFIIGLIIISSLISHIVKPIKKLVLETKKIKNFEIDTSTHIESYLKEVIELTEAIDSMKIGLRSFEKYVPRDLVRQLIQAGTAAKIGGNKLDLAIFFSDIKDFTTITETVSTNQLIKQVNEYFEALSEIITKEHGTIDKYIGDAMMVFWGAPFPVADPCASAALAALHCEEKVKQLNSFWQEEHEPPFKTRIGIHYGEAIVGNIGSSQRLNYTALGDNVNLASRLVNTNKIYGTQILVSDVVYEQLKYKFIFRLVDKVNLRGIAHNIKVYELLGISKTQIAFDIDRYNELFAAAFEEYQLQNWQTAAEYFAKCREIYPDDSLVTLFITRCEYYALNPPGRLWSGAHQIR